MQARWRRACRVKVDEQSRRGLPANPRNGMRKWRRPGLAKAMAGLNRKDEDDHHRGSKPRHGPAREGWFTTNLQISADDDSRKADSQRCGQRRRRAREPASFMRTNVEHDVAGQGAGRHKSDASEVFGGPTGRTGTSNARAPIARASWHLDVDSVHPGV